MLSRGQCEGLRCWTISVRAERHARSNKSKTAGQVGETAGFKSEGKREYQTSETLPIKNLTKSSQSSCDGTIQLWGLKEYSRY